MRFSINLLSLGQKLHYFPKLSANTISELYKARWQNEIFFREIKQLLHIKSFIGTSENAVMIQIRIALIKILILKVMKAMAKYKWHPSNLVAFIRLSTFVKIQLQLCLGKPFEEPPKIPHEYNQGFYIKNIDFGTIRPMKSMKINLS